MIEEQLEILRRIAERGLAQAQERKTQDVDIWQHMLDEIARTKPMVGKHLYEVDDTITIWEDPDEVEFTSVETKIVRGFRLL